MAQLRASEFSRLGSDVYVDHAGATLPSERQLREVFQVRWAPAALQDFRNEHFERMEPIAHPAAARRRSVYVCCAWCRMDKERKRKKIL